MSDLSDLSRLDNPGEEVEEAFEDFEPIDGPTRYVFGCPECGRRVIAEGDQTIDCYECPDEMEQITEYGGQWRSDNGGKNDG